MARFIERVRWRVGEALGRPWVDHSGVLLKVDSPLISTKVRRAIHRRLYERAEYLIVSKTIDKVDKVLELGSCIGFLGVAACRHVGDGNVTLVEANPQLIPLLHENLRRNECRPRVVHAMVAPVGGKGRLCVSQDIWSSRGSECDGARCVEVPTVGFQDLLSEVQPSYLIMDVEGAESALVREGIMGGSTVRKLCIELHPHYIGNTEVSSLIRRIEDDGFVTQWGQCRDGSFYFKRV
jgi:FkbM family methyltransferase